MHIVYNVLQNEMHNRMRCIIKAIISGSALPPAAVKENSYYSLDIIRNEFRTH